MKFKVGDKVRYKGEVELLGTIESFDNDLYFINIEDETICACVESEIEDYLFLDEINNSESQKKIAWAMEKFTEVKSLTLPTNSEARKEIPLFSGCLKYFPAALAGVAALSKKGNDKHNAGQDLHHARGKSMDHADCIVRHLVDVADLLAKLDRGEEMSKEQLLEEASSLAWRALALSQELHEKHDGVPLAPGAKLYK